MGRKLVKAGQWIKLEDGLIACVLGFRDTKPLNTPDGILRKQPSLSVEDHGVAVVTERGEFLWVTPTGLQRIPNKKIWLYGGGVELMPGELK
jgi:hypothetical protein